MSPGEALAALFATVDAVFTEPEPFSHPQVGLGRIHREWERARAAIEAEAEVFGKGNG